MAAFILGEKSAQSQTFTKAGLRVPTTFVKTSPCFIIDMKTPGKHGYFSVRLGYGKNKNIKKPVLGEITKAGIKTPLRFLREFRLEKYGEEVKVVDESDKQGLQIGEQKLFSGMELKPTALFKPGDLVNATGTSKGKGFQGPVKRHHFKGGPKTHGQSDRERAPGSIGMTTTPGRVFKGKRMAGRMGGETVTVRKLEVIEVTDEGILVKGLIPGHRGALVELRTD